MTIKISEILDYHSESSTVDFKMEQYQIGKNPKKYELLKDISAMSNFPGKEDKFIIIGVVEKNGRPSEFHNIQSLIDQSKYQQFIDSNIEPSINFEYNSLNYKGYSLAYFRIFNNNNRPYLFKKDIINSAVNDKVEFREGDGFIRVGTSTKKMTRSDFDKIYEQKYLRPDRKNDLLITPYYGKPVEEDLSRSNILKYLDISLENTSNKSIELDIEIKIFKGEGYKLFYESDLIKELRKRKPKQRTALGYVMPEIDLPLYDFHVEYQDFTDYVLVTRIKFRNQTTDIRLPQRSIEKDVFYKKIIVLQEKTVPIKAEIIIRSDDFSDGIFTQTVEL